MMTRPWYAVDWRRLALILAIPVIISLTALVYNQLFAHKVACVVEQNGELVKAWNNGCKLPNHGLFLKRFDFMSKALTI